MLLGRKQIILVLSLLAMLLGNKVAYAEGGYTPCLVHPVFVQPLISPAVIAKGEILPPTFINSPVQPWSVQLADFEQAAYVQPVIAIPRWDDCSNISASYRSYIQKLNRLSPSGGNRYIRVPAAHRIFTDAGSCCGGR